MQSNKKNERKGGTIKWEKKRTDEDRLQEDWGEEAR